MDGNVVFSIVKAADFAAVKHKGQKRKDPEGTPYINHPIGVAAILTQARDEGGIVLDFFQLFCENVETMDRLTWDCRKLL